ncbi:MAG: exodeoxyribonuclease V subunit gamma [Desulforhopalus sp.]|nr:exodeoxyribonuclease V subunit gamma [Desulforhopalus sp.]
MFYLHVANRTETLLQRLAFILEEDRQEDFFAPELFLIQSQGMERMVAQGLADRFGSFCNFQFFLPLNFLGYIAERLDLGISPDGFERQVLGWRLDDLLRHNTSVEFQPLASYLTGENSELKCFQLARRLANIFDQYQVLRPEFLTSWEAGKLVSDHPAEPWQAALWRLLLAQPGGGTHRGMLFRRVIDTLRGEGDLSQRLPKRISVIGLHTMPPIFLEYLNSLAGHMDIHLLLLSPCRHYWGDVESRRIELKRMAWQSQADQAPPPEHHPLLAALGRQGRDFQNMLLETVEFFEEWEGYDQPLAGEGYTGATLLQRLQSDLLDDRWGDVEQTAVSAEDDSIRVVSCHSRLRELQVLKDHLLLRLHRDAGLELREIIVMAPDIQEYAALIPAVFADIQHSIADRSMRRRNGTLAAFLRFLNLFTGRFGWSEVLDLLRQPTVYPQFHLVPADLDSLQQWIIKSGIRWGLSGRQRQEDGLPAFAETSWRAGLQRLLMGYAIAVDEPVCGVLPYPDIEGRGAQPLGGLCRFIEVLEQARGDFRQPKSIASWSTFLLHYSKILFGDSDDRDLVELHSILAEPAESFSRFHESPVGFPVIHEWLRLSAKESRSSSGFLRGQLTFCSMLPMRSIPFRVVCLLGLSDGAFPKNDRHDTFDLLAGDFRPGDRSPRADDRYQFLEAVLAARSHLYLSYVGQSIKNGEAIPPSTVLAEFLEALATSYGAGDLVVNHPLHPFSGKYFADARNGKLFSYNDYFCRTAAAMQDGGKVRGLWWQGRITRESVATATIHLIDLLAFAASPQKFFVKNILGIRLDLGDDLPEEREVFVPSGLDSYLVDQELVRMGLGGRLSGAFQMIQAEGRWPLGAPGDLTARDKRKKIEGLLERLAALGLGKEQAAMPVDIHTAGQRLAGSLGNQYQGGILLLSLHTLRGRDLLTGWIYHLLARQLRPESDTFIVTADQTIRFTAENEGPTLERLLSLYTEACHRPLPLFVEPALAYARQLASPKARSGPLEKALASYRKKMENRYEPEWALLYGETAAEEVLGGEFEALTRETICPLWRGTDGR